MVRTPSPRGSLAGLIARPRDASIGFLIYFAQALSSIPPPETSALKALVQSSKVRRLRVLELGAGCGIVGIAFAQLVKCDLRVTDLEDAQAILAKNVGCATPMAGSTVKADIMDWASRLEDSSNAIFDLILVSDCIYNPDSSLHLVEILKQLALRAPNTLILVGFKRRHEADTIFFDRMQATNFETVETMNLPLPHTPTDYDSNTPTAEFYAYRRRAAAAHDV
jgi:predicted nicotinamide N-methyase